MFRVYVMWDLPLTLSQLSEIWLLLCNPETFNNSKTLALVDFTPLFLGDRKVFRAKLKVNINNFWLCDEFSATVIDEAAWEKSKSAIYKFLVSWIFNKNIYIAEEPNGERRNRCGKFTLKLLVHSLYPIWLYQLPRKEIERNIAYQMIYL